YGEIVARVLRDEIGHGEGANFVIHRVFTATVDGDPVEAARAAFRNLLVGAPPERHVSVADGLTMMNPISGTFRHDGTRELVDFLADGKETDELYMVL